MSNRWLFLSLSLSPAWPALNACLHQDSVAVIPGRPGLRSRTNRGTTAAPVKDYCRGLPPATTPADPVPRTQFVSNPRRRHHLLLLLQMMISGIHFRWHSRHSSFGVAHHVLPRSFVPAGGCRKRFTACAGRCGSYSRVCLYATESHRVGSSSELVKIIPRFPTQIQFFTDNSRTRQ